MRVDVMPFDCPAGEPLLPPERFPDRAATDAEQSGILGPHFHDERGRNAESVRFRFSCGCAGWEVQPTPAELYDAVRAVDPTERQKDVIREWLHSASHLELLEAWAQGVYTLRMLVRAAHRADAAGRRLANSWINSWAAPDAGNGKAHAS